jgi:hypothetical protein
MLSFVLNNYDVAMAELIGNIRTGLLELDELLGQIQTHRVSHGGFTRQVTGPQVVETQMVNTQAMFAIDRNAFINTDVTQFTESTYLLFDSFHTEQKKLLLEMVSQTTEAVGNTVDAHGKNFWDAYLEMIEKTEMVFDEGGNHNYQMVLNPKTAEKLRENPPTEEQKQRIQEAINLKRKEYYERRPARKLS